MVLCRFYQIGFMFLIILVLINTLKLIVRKKSYKVPTDSTFSTRYYCCIVNYEIDGKTYSSKSKFTEIAVVSNELEIPEIENQPQSISWIKGKPLTETLDVSLKTVVGQGNAQYQWYENTENNNESGIAVAGATKSSYKPPVSEAGTTYYYCQIWYERNDLFYEQGKKSRSEYFNQ